MSIRVLVVDDSAFMRKVLSEMIASEPGLEVVGTARDGADGVFKTIKYRPDLITLDIEMPEMSGLEALRKILHTPEIDPKPTILMCSSLTMDGSVEALHALRLGAADFIAKDPQAVGNDDGSFRTELIHKIKAIAAPRQRHAEIHSKGEGQGRVSTIAQSHQSKPETKVVTSEIESLRPDCIAIGSSTGGPPVVETIVCSLTSDFPAPVLIAQHMPALFTKSLAKRLNAVAQVEVKLAEHGEEIRRGVVYIGEGGKHIRVRKSGSLRRIEISVKPEDAPYKPSVNELFASVAKHFGAGALGFMLTGMGDDGAVGSRAFVEAGGRIVTQEASTCVVYGMPKALVDAGLSSGAASPRTIASILKSMGEAWQGTRRASA
jgi:two-component system, chemotaxis family, protein-glutamate methylesterase/glutaminase